MKINEKHRIKRKTKGKTPRILRNHYSKEKTFRMQATHQIQTQFEQQHQNKKANSRKRDRWLWQKYRDP